MPYLKQVGPFAESCSRRWPFIHEYLGRHGDRAIAAGLNRDGIPCPSAHRRDQNKHRFVDGWQGSAARAILENPRYTGYAVFGWWSKHDTLLDPDDVPAGHLERFRRAAVDRVVRSRRPAHPAIISVAEFIEAQLLRRRAAGGLDARQAGTGTEANEAALPPEGACEMYILRASPGGHAPAEPDVLPLCCPNTHAWLPGPV